MKYTKKRYKINFKKTKKYSKKINSKKKYIQTGGNIGDDWDRALEIANDLANAEMGADIFALVTKMYLKKYVTKKTSKEGVDSFDLETCASSASAEATSAAETLSCDAANSVLKAGSMSAMAVGGVAALSGAATGAAIAGGLASSEKTEDLKNNYNTSNDEIQTSAANAKDAASASGNQINN